MAVVKVSGRYTISTSKKRQLFEGFQYLACEAKFTLSRAEMAVKPVQISRSKKQLDLY